MTNEEIYAKAQELGVKITLEMDALQAEPQEAMSVLGYAVALLVHTYATQQGKPVEAEADYFARYVKAASATLVPKIEQRHDDHN